MLQAALQSWEKAAGPNEGRRQAGVMIHLAYKKGASELNLSNLGLRKLPPQRYRLQSLKKIQVSNNPFNHLPEDFKHFTALEPVVLTPSVEHTVKTPEVKQAVDPFLQSLQKWEDDYLRKMVRPENLITERKKLDTVIEKVYHAYKNKAETLDLSNLGIATLPYQLTQLSSLKRLDISHNNFYALPANIHLFTNLEVLIAAKNNLKNLPEALIKLHHLKVLYVKNNNLFKHVNNIYEPHRLDKTRRLIDSMAVKTDVDDQYNLLPYHEKIKTKSMKENLDLWVNQAFGLEKENRVKVAAQLLRAREYYRGTSQFILEGHGVNSLPENVFSYLTHLTSFKVNNIKLTESPEVFSQLTSLWELGFTNSDIPKIPPGIALLPALQGLAFSHCQLTELTKEDVGLLHNVRNLILNNNRLTALPDLSSLDNMRILDVSDNRLHEFSSKGFLFPRKLFKLNLSDNHLETIPEDIGDLLDYPENQTPILSELSMDSNPIKSRSPKLIKNLPRLFYVNFNTDYIDDRIIEERLVTYQGPQYAHETRLWLLTRLARPTTPSLQPPI